MTQRTRKIDRAGLVLALATVGLLMVVANHPILALALGISALGVIATDERVRPWLARLVGHKHDTRYTWGELSFHRKAWHWGLRLTNVSSGGDLVFIQLPFMTLLFYVPTKFCSASTMDRSVSFGLYTIDRDVVWRWGLGYWSWAIPFFSMKHQLTEVLSLDGKRCVWREDLSDSKSWSQRFAEKDAAAAANRATVTYDYRLRSGAEQRCMATVHVERWTWGRKWAPWWKKVRTCIEVQFNAEVGERSGSWKGGCIACSWDMLRGETWLDALRRMERERKFE